MSFPRKVMWKASDGREFMIDTVELNINNREELMTHIDKLRKENGYSEPTFMHVSGPEAHVLDAIHTDELPEEVRSKVLDVIKEGLEKPDPKTMN